MKAVFAFLFLIVGVPMGAFTEHDDLATVLCVASAGLAIWHLITRDRNGGV